MAGGSVTFSLDNGETLSLADEDLRPIYDALWGLAPESGAVSTAALLKEAWRLHPLARKPIALTTPQSTVLRKAISLLPAYELGKWGAASEAAQLGQIECDSVMR